MRTQDPSWYGQGSHENVEGSWIVQSALSNLLLTVNWWQHGLHTSLFNVDAQLKVLMLVQVISILLMLKFDQWRLSFRWTQILLTSPTKTVFWSKHFQPDVLAISSTNFILPKLPSQIAWLELTCLASSLHKTELKHKKHKPNQTKLKPSAHAGF